MFLPIKSPMSMPLPFMRRLIPKRESYITPMRDRLFPYLLALAIILPKSWISTDFHRTYGKLLHDLKSTVFEKGDLILFYTDGLCDSLYKDNPEEFIQKLKELLLDYKNQPSEEIIESILNQFYNLDDSSKYETDDVSIIICKI